MSEKLLPLYNEEPKRARLMDHKWSIIGYSSILMAIFFLLIQYSHSCSLGQISEHVPSQMLGYSSASAPASQESNDKLFEAVSLLQHAEHIGYHNRYDLIMEEYILLD